MSVTTTSGYGSMADRWAHRALLQRSKPRCVHNLFGRAFSLPQKNTDTMAFRRQENLDSEPVVLSQDQDPAPEQVQKFDPSTLMQGVRDRIKATFVSLIPDEQWEQMVETEMKSFFYATTDRWGNVTKSQFKDVLDAELARRSREAINALLNKDDFMINYSGSGPELVTDYIRKELVANAPDLFARTLERTIASVVEQMKYNLKEEIRRGE